MNSDLLRRSYTMMHAATLAVCEVQVCMKFQQYSNQMQRSLMQSAVNVGVARIYDWGPGVSVANANAG